MEAKTEEEGENSGSPAKSPSKADEFNFEGAQGYDSAREKFEILAIKMDLHKNGILYLKELVLTRTLYTRLGSLA